MVRITILAWWISYDRPYEALIAAFARINPHLTSLHQEAQARVAWRCRLACPWRCPRQILIPMIAPSANGRRARALVPGSDRTLSRRGLWRCLSDLESCRCRIWRPSRMDYDDPELLTIGETVPLGEVFHLDWGIDAGAGPQRFALSIVPPKAFPKDGLVHTRGTPLSYHP